jgi:hypothetical protein
MDDNRRINAIAGVIRALVALTDSDPRKLLDALEGVALSPYETTRVREIIGVGEWEYRAAVIKAMNTVKDLIPKFETSGLPGKGSISDSDLRSLMSALGTVSANVYSETEQAMAKYLKPEIRPPSLGSQLLSVMEGVRRMINARKD